MKNLLTTLVWFTISSVMCSAQLPQKFDSLYKTIFAKDFCTFLQQKSDLVLIDVRSAGEFSDTSSSTSLNLGHLRGAINIGIDSMKKNMAAMEQYRNKTLVLYCSHSQRSRRVSKLLAENGFTNFYNLNGGISSLTQLSDQEFPCKKELIETNLRYTNIAPTDAAALYRKEKSLVVIDVRSQVEFASKDSSDYRNLGRVRGAMNIPYDTFRQRLSELKVAKSTPILVYTVSGDGDAARAANDLIANGFTTVYHLLGGFGGLLINSSTLSIVENPPPFHFLDAPQALALLKNSSRAMVIYDVRPKVEFENKDEKIWKNLGNINKAVNVNVGSLATLSLPTDKTKPVLIYGSAEALTMGKILAAKGYTSVHVMESFYDFVWSGFNLETCKGAKEFLVNHDGLF
jgi:rhodanese-related sulfurtransferase